jgi:DNA-binding CsgD family transcriptional regulator
MVSLESWQIALALSSQLFRVASIEDYLATGFSFLSQALPGDLVLWTGLNFAAGTARVIQGGVGPVPELGSGLARAGHDHPSILSYLKAPDDLGPRRISDVVDAREWRGTDAYNEVFRDLGAEHQLSLVVRLEPPAEGDGWVITRSDSDFSDADVDLARHLLPVLSLSWAHVHPSWSSSSSATKPDGPVIQLSDREDEALQLLASGCTTVAMARRMNISVSTTRKHLDHLYSKVGEHDRLLVVEQARALGLLKVNPHRGVAS